MGNERDKQARVFAHDVDGQVVETYLNPGERKIFGPTQVDHLGDGVIKVTQVSKNGESDVVQYGRNQIRPSVGSVIEVVPAKKRPSDDEIDFNSPTC